MAGSDGEDISKRFTKMSVDSNDINILLLGESGVGKSTFINAFANYFFHEHFHVAEKSVVRCLIPARFTVLDENYEEKLVTIGKDANENEELGASATFGTRSYVFPIMKRNLRIRFIDTPGVVDTRGKTQDNENLENILSYISHMEHLHAICFLLRPSQSRISAIFEYCIKQLLSRLEKSASNNIIFLFTNTRSTFYRPGDTKSSLQKVLDDIKSKPPHVNIKFNKENIFCLDNEAFRFLVACKNNIKFTEENKVSFAASWSQSVQECWRMIDYITGFGGKPKLNPHLVKNSLSVNDARRVIIQLSQPLADIADLINDNITLLQRHQKGLNTENMSMSELKKRLYVPVINLKHKELAQPTTVCANAKCTEVYMVNEKKKYHYKQRCHDPCYLTNVPKEMIGSPELINCYAINSSTKLCNECSCDFSSHMHIYYQTETFEDKISDDGVKLQINDRETAVNETQKLIKKIKSRKQDYEHEKEIIVKTMAKFAHFLQQNAISPYNDAYKAYVEYLIDREKSYGSDADTQLIRYYYDLLKQYEEEKKILDDAMNTPNNDVAVISASDVFDSVQCLFNLRHTGKKINELHSKRSSLQQAEHNEGTECVLEHSGTRKKQFSKASKQTKNSPPIQRLMDVDLQKLVESCQEIKGMLNQEQKNNNRGKFPNRTGSNQSYQDIERKKKNNKQGYQHQKNQQRRGRGELNQGNHRSNWGGNQHPGPHNRGPYNQGPYNQEPYNQGPYNQGPYNQGPYNQGPHNQGAHNQGPFNRGPHNQGPFNRGPHNQGPYNQGPYNQGPHNQGPHNQGPHNQGPHNQGPHNQGPYNQGPYNQGPHNQGPRNQGYRNIGLRNQGSHNQGPNNSGNHNQRPNNYNQGPNIYNHEPDNLGPGSYNLGPNLHNSGLDPNQQPISYNHEPVIHNPGRFNSGQNSYNRSPSPNAFSQNVDPNFQDPYNLRSYQAHDQFNQASSNLYKKNPKTYKQSKYQDNLPRLSRPVSQGEYNTDEDDDNEIDDLSNSGYASNQNRSMGPYRPDDEQEFSDESEKTGNSYNYFRLNSEINSDNEDIAFDQFAKFNNFEIINKKSKGMQRNKPFNRGGGRGNRRDNRGRPKCRSNSQGRYEKNSDSDSDSKSFKSSNNNNDNTNEDKKSKFDIFSRIFR